MRGPRSKGQLAKLNTSGVFVHDKLDHNRAKKKTEGRMHDHTQEEGERGMRKEGKGAQVDGFAS